jgi:hypothetical protein
MKPFLFNPLLLPSALTQTQRLERELVNELVEKINTWTRTCMKQLEFDKELLLAEISAVARKLGCTEEKVLPIYWSKLEALTDYVNAITVSPLPPPPPADLI